MSKAPVKQILANDCRSMQLESRPRKITNNKCDCLCCCCFRYKRARFSALIVKIEMKEILLV